MNRALRPSPPISRQTLLWITGVMMLTVGSMGMKSVEAQREVNYRQPAYITNAYFSDKMTQKGETMQPRSVIKALRVSSEEVSGYFVLDLMLTSSGMHHVKVDILDHQGTLATRLDYPPIQATREEQLPMFTAAGTVAGDLAPGLWFFKVYDQVDKKEWENLGTFAIQVVANPGE
ncbi:MAG: hypothetical protein HQM00_04850 [Magnetococcales bacterium]|nr:hypothetical protein [Magnetococcales bacterium]